MAHIRKDPGNWHAIPWDRVLAECEAKRRLVQAARASEVDWAYWGGDDDLIQRGRHSAWLHVLTTLALPYADHLDYLPEWKP